MLKKVKFRPQKEGERDMQQMYGLYGQPFYFEVVRQIGCNGCHSQCGNVHRNMYYTVINKITPMYYFYQVPDEFVKNGVIDSHNIALIMDDKKETLQYRLDEFGAYICGIYNLEKQENWIEIRDDFIDELDKIKKPRIKPAVIMKGPI